jgi:hypothetical protein
MNVQVKNKNVKLLLIYGPLRIRSLRFHSLEHTDPILCQPWLQSYTFPSSHKLVPTYTPNNTSHHHKIEHNSQ